MMLRWVSPNWTYMRMSAQRHPLASDFCARVSAMIRWQFFASRNLIVVIFCGAHYHPQSLLVNSSTLFIECEIRSPSTFFSLDGIFNESFIGSALINILLFAALHQSQQPPKLHSVIVGAAQQLLIVEGGCEWGDEAAARRRNKTKRNGEAELSTRRRSFPLSISIFS